MSVEYYGEPSALSTGVRRSTSVRLRILLTLVGDGLNWFHLLVGFPQLVLDFFIRIGVDDMYLCHVVGQKMTAVPDVDGSFCVNSIQFKNLITRHVWLGYT